MSLEEAVERCPEIIINVAQLLVAIPSTQASVMFIFSSKNYKS